MSRRKIKDILFKVYDGRNNIGKGLAPEKRSEMKLDDLKTNMVVELRNGLRYLVLQDAVTFYCNGNYDGLYLLCIDEKLNWHGNNHGADTLFNDDMTYQAYVRDDRSGDIVKVYIPTHVYAIRGLFSNKHDIVDAGWFCIWKRGQK